MKMTRLAALILVVVSHSAWSADSSTKDIVLSRVAPPVAGATATLATPADDAMVVSVLVESPNGTLTPRAVNASFRTGERFRVKMLSSRDGSVALYNTKPSGELVTEPLWRGQVQRGLEIMTPRLALEGQRGTDQLHVVLEPLAEAPAADSGPGLIAWLGNVLGGKSKDIRLDVQNTRSDTYLLGAPGKGLVTTVRISHR